jgi:DNA-binding NarL/FixJ family response regulator
VVPTDGNVTVKQILIADDHEVVRSGLRAIIETRADWIVCGEAADGREAVAWL